MSINVWNEITYLFPNYAMCAVEVREWMEMILFHNLVARGYLSILGLKLIHISKSVPGCQHTKSIGT